MDNEINVNIHTENYSNSRNIEWEKRVLNTPPTTYKPDDTKSNSTNNDEYGYLNGSMSVAEIQEELAIWAKDLRDAEFMSTLDIVRGVKEGYSSTMQVVQDIIERLEEKSPDPNNDTLITALYTVYDALSDMKKKCDFL